MRFIAHRGNWCGKKIDYENHPAYIDEAISKGFDIEMDLWKKDGALYSGHDFPNHLIDEKYLLSIVENAWIHAKNLEILEWLNQFISINWFWHENDKITLTSKKIIWTYPDIFIENSIINQPTEQSMFWNNKLWEKNTFFGICHDDLVWCKQVIG